MDLSQLLPDHFQLIHRTIRETAIEISLIATQTVGRYQPINCLQIRCIAYINLP
ncbi:hypothetical protein [Spirosoma migulaei]